MGLDCSHGAWHGAYSHFMRFRRALARAINLDIDAMEGFGSPYRPWPQNKPLVVLLNHSDCDGEIEPQHLEALANRLEEVKAEFIVQATDYCCDNPGEHIDDWVTACRTAAAANESIEFG